MESWVVRKYAEIEACKARIEGMKAENLKRDTPSESPAYDEEDFLREASNLEGIARELI